MQVFQGFDNLPVFNHAVVTVGSYDGVHAGHRVLLDRIRNTARATNGESVLITFSPHPRKVLEYGPVGLLSTLREKEYLLSGAGIDNLIVVPFTPEFSRLDSETFVRDYLCGKVRARKLYVGYNHRFGKDKEGDFRVLDRLSAELGFEICEIPRQEVDREKVSSTVIRDLIAAGRMREAETLLGHPYVVLLHQDKESFRPDDTDKLLPPNGIYSVRVLGPSTSAVTVAVMQDARIRLPEYKEGIGNEIWLGFI